MILHFFFKAGSLTLLSSGMKRWRYRPKREITIRVLLNYYRTCYEYLLVTLEDECLGGKPFNLHQQTEKETWKDMILIVSLTGTNRWEVMEGVDGRRVRDTWYKWFYRDERRKGGRLVLYAGTGRERSAIKSELDWQEGGGGKEIYQSDMLAMCVSTHKEFLLSVSSNTDIIYKQYTDYCIYT